MAVWFGGLLLLPPLLASRPQARGPAADHWGATGKTLFFHLMTPAAVLTIVFGTALLGYGFDGAWLPAKLALVAIAVLLHVYFGMQLVALWKGRASPATLSQRLAGWVPALLLLLIAALAAAKPVRLPPLGGI